MRVAMAQLLSGRDPARNVEQAVAAVRAAADEGASLVVLPEATQHAFGPPGEPLIGVAEPLDGPFVESLSAVAQRTGSTVVAGMFERCDSPTHVFNTVVVVDRDGLRAPYRKVHLYDAFGARESDVVTAGDPAQLAVVPVGDLSVGVMTCYDLRFPEIARVLVDRGATAIAVPAAWFAGQHKVAQWRVLLRARAIEETVFVLAAAQPAPTCCGHSSVIDPGGVALVELGPDDSGCAALATASVDPQVITEIRAANPVLANRRFTVAS
jgi:deaminated glutathione amidase